MTGVGVHVGDVEVLVSVVDVGASLFDVAVVEAAALLPPPSVPEGAIDKET